ncbi:hypothetical protein PHISP_05238 [Aspergillus sp. HF37]|nr:hypothetical protein PHISP_05238 [Aspergillus sp. HF37]
MDNGNGNPISLVDKTTPSQRSDDEPAQSAHPSSRVSRYWTRKSKYAKWQRPKTGSDVASSQTPEADESVNGASGKGVNTVDFATSDQGIGNNGNGTGNETGNRSSGPNQSDHIKPIRELDILYENQRGWFLFGIPLYSHGSLLNFDPSAWVTQELKDSPVNITNAQLPDPSWKWAWHTWYVDMSNDVDEHGWQYSWSFSSTAWHGAHPWFHSFVRRRRWVRLRVKRERAPRGRSGFEKAHMLNQDYFTIHPRKERTIASSAARDSLSSDYESRATTKMNEGVAGLEEIGDIPTLMCAFRVAIVDREKMEALKRFIQDGGEELYYLDGKIPEIMASFVFQTSRWQFLTYLTDIVNGLSQRVSEADETQRKHYNLAKAAETAKYHVRGPDIVGDINRESVTGMLDLSPISKQHGLLSRHIGRPVEDMVRPGRIKGIPKEAEVGREGHIY